MIIYNTSNWRLGIIVALDTKLTQLTAERCLEGLRDNKDNFYFDLSEAQEMCEELRKEALIVLENRKNLNVESDELESIIATIDAVRSLKFDVFNLSDEMLETRAPAVLLTKYFKDFYKI